MALVRKGLLATVGSGRGATYRMPSKRPTIDSNGSSPLASPLLPGFFWFNWTQPLHSEPICPVGRRF